MRARSLWPFAARACSYLEMPSAKLPARTRLSPSFISWLVARSRVVVEARGIEVDAEVTPGPVVVAVDPSPAASHWCYAGFPVTQYWKKPAGAWRDDLHRIGSERAVEDAPEARAEVIHQEDSLFDEQMIALLRRQGDRFRPVAGAEFAHNRADVKFDCPLADDQGRGDLFVLQSLG